MYNDKHMKFKENFMRCTRCGKLILFSLGGWFGKNYDEMICKKCFYIEVNKK